MSKACSEDVSSEDDFEDEATVSNYEFYDAVAEKAWQDAAALEKAKLGSVQKHAAEYDRLMSNRPSQPSGWKGWLNSTSRIAATCGGNLLNKISGMVPSK
jgi:hypothetical protein